MSGSRLLLATGLGVLMLLALACARRRDGAQLAARALPDSVFVEVINENYYDARVHLIYAGGARHPLGTIGGNQRQPAVAIAWQPRSFVVEVTLIIGGGVYRSDAIDVTAGDVVEIRVPPNLDASGFFRRIPR